MQVIPYEAIGGEQAVRKLVDRFYDLMDTLPEAQGIRALHPESLAGSREKLFMFLSGWLGGPPLFAIWASAFARPAHSLPDWRSRARSVVALYAAIRKRVGNRTTMA
jgi:hemoglobin